jgi:hypothetical protein
MDVLGITHVRDIEGPRERIFIPWNGDEMDMIIHQAISQYRSLVFGTIFPNQIQISQTIRLAEEYFPVVIASLCEVVGKPCGNYAGNSGHDRNFVSRSFMPYRLENMKSTSRIDLYQSMKELK